MDARQPYSIAALTLIMILIRHHHQHTTSAHPRAARPNKADRTKPTNPTGMTGRLTDTRPIPTRPGQNLPGDGILGEGRALTYGILGELTYELE